MNANTEETVSVKAELDTIEKSVVHVLTAGHGLGVISNGYIFTASHCLDAKLDDSLAIGDSQFQKCLTHDGQEFWADVLFLDPASDLAVLCCPDDQLFPKLSETFVRAVCDCGIELFEGKLPIAGESPITVRIRNKIGWADGVLLHSLNGGGLVEASLQINGGASGGPVLEASTGKLIAINSWYTESERPCAGMQPLLARALPVWLANRLFATD